MGLLQQQPSTLGHVAVRFADLSLLRVLGKGRYCTAFESTMNADADRVVTKVFLKVDDKVANNEMKVLQKLAEGTVENVPQCKALATSECEQFAALVVSPVGQAVLPIHGGCRTVGDHWAAIVSTLRGAHELGIAHRDVKPGNILVTESGIIILIDWGSSCTLNERVAWVGTPGYSEPADEDGYHTPSAVHDLKALLRSVYSMMTQEVPPCGADNETIYKFWEERWGESTCWGSCLAAVNDCNYDALALIFRSLK